MHAILAALISLLFAAPVFAQTDAFTQAIQKGPLYAAAAAYVGGLLTSLTPCVYPMIAITVSVFGAKQARSRGEAMLLSSSFVLGIVVLFTSMLVGVALAGGVFGSILANRWVTVGIATVFFLMALSMFGAFEMVLPDSVMQRISGVGGVGYSGAFLLGLMSGIVAAPCTGPVLTGILLWIGKTQNVGLGIIVGAAFSLGLGTLFWLVGTFAVNLPKGGRWMLAVKSVFGIVMVVTALYFLKNAFPFLWKWIVPNATFFGALAALGVVGLLLGAVQIDFAEPNWGLRIRKAVGIVAVSLAGAGAWAGAEVPTSSLTWLPSEGEASALARGEKRPLIVDFTADWCGACKELATKTFADPAVQTEMSGWVAAKIDATNEDDPKIVALFEKYKVVGLPTVVIFDSTGAERARINEFVSPEAFLPMIATIE